MDEADQARLDAVWNQTQIPVVLRRGGKGEKLRIRLPYASDNRIFLQSLGKHAPTWVADKRFWETPKAWFNSFVEKSLDKYRSVYIVQPYREQEVCARACMEAHGHECNCSCMGLNHGSGMHGSWFEASDTFATRWGDRQLACRLLKAK